MFFRVLRECKRAARAPEKSTTSIQTCPRTRAFRVRLNKTSTMPATIVVSIAITMQSVVLRLFLLRTSPAAIRPIAITKPMGKDVLSCMWFLLSTRQNSSKSCTGVRVCLSLSHPLWFATAYCWPHQAHHIQAHVRGPRCIPGIFHLSFLLRDTGVSA